MQTLETPAQVEAEYDLEVPARCPSCAVSMHKLHVIRLLRARVNFTSNLPRRGYAVVCPSCSTILSANMRAGL
jgi:hypothetical protein